MPTIISPYANSKTLGDDVFGIGSITDAFFGPKASTAAYTREKFREQQRQNVGVEELATLLQNPNAAPGALAAAAARGGVTSQNLGGYNQFGVIGRAPDIRDPSVARSVLQAGGNYATTPVAFDQNLQKSYDIADMQSRRAAASQEAIANRTLVPTMTAAGPVYTRSIDAPGQRPVLTMPQEQGIQFQQNWPTGFAGLNPQQQAGINVEPKKPDWFNWVAPPLTPGGPPQRGTSTDGRTDATTGQPLPNQYQLYTPSSQGAGATASGFQPGATEQKDYRSAVRHADQTIQLGTKIKEIVDRNPTAIGPVGNLRLLGQEGLDLLNSLNMQFGGGKPGGYDASVVQTRAALQQRYGAGVARLLPELFDSDLNSVRTMNGMLIYKAAAALGQSGRDASDKDIAVIRGLTGDPASWWQGPTGYKDKITQLMSIIQTQRDDDYGRLAGQSVIPPGGTGAPGATGVPGGGTTSTGVPWTVGP